MGAVERLPEAELDVMLALWQFDRPARTARILQEVSARRAWTLPTLKVILGRLVEKGYVEVSREGRFTLYRATLREADYRRQETRGIARRYFDDSVKKMIASLVQEEDLTGADIAELEAILHKAGRGKTNG